jgi:hypothetical protein
MERLKSAVPADLRRAVGEGTTRDLPSTTSLLLNFLDGLPLFHQVITHPAASLYSISCSWPPASVARRLGLWSHSVAVSLLRCRKGHQRADRPGARAVPQGQGEGGGAEAPGQRVLLPEGLPTGAQFLFAGTFCDHKVENYS